MKDSQEREARVAEKCIGCGTEVVYVGHQLTGKYHNVSDDALHTCPERADRSLSDKGLMAPEGDGVECVNCASVVRAFTSSKRLGYNAPAQRALHRDWPELAAALTTLVESTRPGVRPTEQDAKRDERVAEIRERLATARGANGTMEKDLAAFRAMCALHLDVDALLSEYEALRKELEEARQEIAIARQLAAYQVQFGDEMRELAHRLEAGLLRVVATEHGPDIWFAHEDCIVAAKKALDGPYTSHNLSPAASSPSAVGTPASSQPSGTGAPNER